MQGDSSRFSLFLADLRRRGVTRLASIYAVAGLGIVEAFDIVGGRFQLPDWSFRVIIILAIVGFPVAMILGWIYDITSKGIVKTKPISATQKASLKLSWKPSWLTIILLFILLIITTAFFVVPRPNALGFKQQDWVLLADLENNTGEEVFDKSLLHALSITIDQSRRINIFPRIQADEVLKRMERDTIKRITMPIALEIAERENIKAVLLLTISELGGTYVLSTNLINPFTGETICSSQEMADGKEEILDALDKLAQKVRKDLGDSLQKIHLQTVPLPKATTHSLEALKYLTTAGNVSGDPYYDRQKELLHKAIELDPEFALAHSNLAAYYYWTNDRESGEKHISLALSQLERLTERERLWIEAAVEGYRGNREASINKWGTYLERYPNTYGGWYRLGYNYMMLNREEESISAFNRALEIYNEDDPGAFINIASCYNRMEEYEKGIEFYHKAFSIRPDYELFPSLNHEYGFAYVEMGKPDVAKEVFYKLWDGNENQKAHGRRSTALLLMFQGKYAEALELMHEAAILHKSIGYKLSELRDRLYLCKIYQAKGMVSEFQAELDHCTGMIRESATEPVWYMRLGVLLTRNGEIETAEEMLQEISDKTNEGNKEDLVAYHLLKGEIALANGDMSMSLEHLETATSLDDNGYNLESLATYYTLAGQWEKAVETYRQLVENERSLGWENQECWVHAHFHLAKAYDQAGDRERANSWYTQLLEIWKEADHDLPELLEAKSRLLPAV
jgi:tetratricopeptide (TPR) repeat protein